jgi:hypothetical protein
LIGFTYAAYLVCQSQNKQFDKFLILNFHIVLSALILLPFFRLIRDQFLRNSNFISLSRLLQ